MLLKACLNGPRLPAEHPALPVTPGALADDARDVVAAGAGALHVHAKDASGADTLAAPAVAAVLTAVRARVPGTPVGVTTGAWAVPDPADRLAAIAAWRVLPDFASVNWHEPGAVEVARLLLDRGVGVEAGLWTEEAAAAWRAWPDRGRCLRVLVEVMGDPADAGPLLAALGSAPVPVLLHGEGAAAWPVFRDAVRRGLDTRIGLEDVLVRPDGGTVTGNAELVRDALDLARRTSVPEPPHQPEDQREEDQEPREPDGRGDRAGPAVQR
jgi:uncharacterized protein (DUF849 family)